MRKRNIPKQRNFLVPIMRLHCKPGPHGGKRRQFETGKGRHWMQEYCAELSAPVRKPNARIVNFYQTEGERP